MARTLAIIPARFAASRLPGKPLIEIAGKAMIEHVYARTAASDRVDRVVVATDHEEIVACVHSFGGEAVLTSADHASGTDRVAEALASLSTAEEISDADVVLNVQGDEPMFDPQITAALVEALERTSADCATPITRINETRDLFEPNVVKAVLRQDFSPLYFSRQPIPHVRDREPEEWLDCGPFYRHIGVYAYRYAALRAFVEASPSAIEQCEALEQLRMLDLGMRMICVEVDYSGIGVDTAEDVMRVERLLSL